MTSTSDFAFHAAIVNAFRANRNRDSEFVDTFNSRKEVLEYWERGWSCLFSVLDGLSAADIGKTVVIRGETAFGTIGDGTVVGAYLLSHRPDCSARPSLCRK